MSKCRPYGVFDRVQYVFELRQRNSIAAGSNDRYGVRRGVRFMTECESQTVAPRGEKLVLFEKPLQALRRAVGSNIQEGRERGCPRSSVACIILYNIVNTALSVSYPFRKSHAKKTSGDSQIEIQTRSSQSKKRADLIGGASLVVEYYTL